ncbi:MAG: hypothetical protein V4850_23455 [Myxococcota bacterium]
MRALLVLFLLSACTPEKPEALEGGDTCTALTSGSWLGVGAALGMPEGSGDMFVELTMDEVSCTFTLDSWSMAMGDLPTGGALDGDALTLDGLTSGWRECTGTASASTAFSGTCDNGDGFEFSADE